MHKGEVIAVSRKGSGSVPDANSILLKSEVFDQAEDNQAWLNLAENLKINYVRKGPCEFKFSDEGDITFIKSFGKKRSYLNGKKEKSKKSS